MYCQNKQKHVMIIIKLGKFKIFLILNTLEAGNEY